MSPLHTRLHELRKEKGLQQADLAALVDVRRETIGNLENGKYNPSLKLALDISHALNTPVDQIFYFDEHDHISLKRILVCPYCKAKTVVDMTDECETSTYERQMGEEIMYEFSFSHECTSCGREMIVSGHICEYPVGAFNDEHIEVKCAEGSEDE